MFKLIDPTTFAGQVTLTTKAGASVTLDVTWRALGDHELGVRMTGDTRTTAALARLIAEWQGVADQNDQPLPPSELAIAKLLDNMDEHAPRAFFEAYAKARRDAAQGN
jgi:hypothetical protein